MDYEALIWDCATLSLGPIVVFFAIAVCFDYIGKFLFGRS